MVVKVVKVAGVVELGDLFHRHHEFSPVGSQNDSLQHDRGEGVELATAYQVLFHGSVR